MFRAHLRLVEAVDRLRRGRRDQRRVHKRDLFSGRERRVHHDQEQDAADCPAQGTHETLVPARGQEQGRGARPGAVPPRLREAHDQGLARGHGPALRQRGYAVRTHRGFDGRRDQRGGADQGHRPAQGTGQERRPADPRAWPRGYEDSQLSRPRSVGLRCREHAAGRLEEGSEQRGGQQKQKEQQRQHLLFPVPALRPAASCARGAGITRALDMRPGTRLVPSYALG
mmetsp:Transcript_109216/g.305348  ORF Transcript_109216/g.305348 Transcript_109216/m.305348 type:complete len:227 (-) Transcript_109216:466-1146(-)